MQSNIALGAATLALAIVLPYVWKRVAKSRRSSITVDTAAVADKVSVPTSLPAFNESLIGFAQYDIVIVGGGTLSFVHQSPASKRMQGPQDASSPQGCPRTLPCVFCCSRQGRGTSGSQLAPRVRTESFPPAASRSSSVAFPCPTEGYSAPSTIGPCTPSPRLTQPSASSTGHVVRQHRVSPG